MEKLYFKLNTGQTYFRDDLLDITLTPEKSYAVADLTNINQNITQGLVEEVIVQVNSSEYYSNQPIGDTETSTPIIEDESDLSPYIYSKRMANSLPTPVDPTFYYLLGNSPNPPFQSYKNYLVRLIDNTYHVYKPHNLDEAIVAISPNSIYYKYFGIWPTGIWRYYINGIEIGGTTDEISGTAIAQITGQSYTTFDLNTTNKIPSGKIINDLLVIREGTPIFVDDGYTLDDTKTQVTFTTPVESQERVVYQFTFKNPA